MNNSKYNKNIYYTLFKQDCCNGTVENGNKLNEYAKEVLDNIGWEKLIDDLYEYLVNEINNRYDAYNFATWLFIYDYNKMDVLNPYPFLALIYKKMRLDEQVDDELEKRFDDPYSRFCDIYYETIVSSKIMSLGDSELIIPEQDNHLMDEVKKIQSD